MKYKVKLPDEIRIIDARDFNVIGNMVMFYDNNNKPICAFNNVYSVEK